MCNEGVSKDSKCLRGWPRLLHFTVDSKTPVFACLAICLLAAAIYSPVLTCGFVNFDDPMYVTMNPNVNQGFTWAGLKAALFSSPNSYYHPLTWVSLMLDATVAGGSRPSVFHLTNLLLHVFNCGLLFWLTRSFGLNAWAGLLTTALFAWHPMNVESVAWVSERKGLLSTSFALLSIGFYCRYARSAGMRPYLLALGAMVLSLLSKPMMVTLPLIFALLDYWPLGRLGAGVNGQKPKPTLLAHVGTLTFEKLPFIAVSGVFCIFTFVNEQDAGNVNSIPAMKALTMSCLAYGEYVAKALVPVNLCPIYPVTLSAGNGFVVLGFASAISAVLVCVRKEKPVLVGFLWFLVGLLPVINIVPHGQWRIADRYAYFPFIGLFLALAWVVAAPRPKRIQNPLMLAVAGFLVACLTLTQLQTRVWKNDRSLYEHTLRVTEDNWFALNNMAWALAMEGSPNKEDLVRAVQLADEACRLTRYQDLNLLDTLYHCQLKGGHPEEAERITDRELLLAAHQQRKDYYKTLVEQKRMFIQPVKRNSQ